MPTVPALRHQFNALPNEVKTHLAKLEDLLANSELDLALAFLFMSIEQGRYRAVKCVLVRKLKCKSDIVDELLSQRAFSRKSFREAIKSLLGLDVSKGDMAALASAETARDTLFHGRKVTSEGKRQAISDCMSFIAAFGSKVKEKTGKNPFSTLTGLAGKTSPLTQDQSRWIIRGVLQGAGVDMIATVPDQ